MRFEPRFFSFDGIDGSGKSTQVALFSQWIRQLGRKLTVCRDPGTTQVGEALRAVLLNHASQPIHRRCEMLIYMAARAQLVEQTIRPALASNEIVVCDRFLTSNIVYQGYAGGEDLTDVRAVGRITVDDVLPDLTFVLDIDPALAARRLAGRPVDRMEAQGVDFFRRAREGFLQEARSGTPHFVVIDASPSTETVQEAIRSAARPLLGVEVAP